MAVYKEMDPEQAWRAIEGYENVLEPEARSMDAFYRQFRCPRCDCPLNKEFDSRIAYEDDTFLNARALLRCATCGFLLEPHSNVVVESGDASKLAEGLVPTVKA